MSKKQIEDAVRHSLESYFKDLRGSEPVNLHDMLISIVEKPLLEVVLKHANNNQSKAAQWLGVNRNTLRKKLSDHKMLG
jgi:Fis family transcriptional regulator